MWQKGENKRTQRLKADTLRTECATILCHDWSISSKSQDQSPLTLLSGNIIGQRRSEGGQGKRKETGVPSGGGKRCGTATGRTQPAIQNGQSFATSSYSTNYRTRVHPVLSFGYVTLPIHSQKKPTIFEVVKFHCDQDNQHVRHHPANQPANQDHC